MGTSSRDPSPSKMSASVVQEYLGQVIQPGRNYFDKDADRRIQLGWAVFGKLSSILQYPKAFNECALPMMKYGAETWTLTVSLLHKFKFAERALSDKIRNISKPFAKELRDASFRQGTRQLHCIHNPNL